MAINIPADAKPVRDQRLNLVHIIGALYKRFVDGDDSIKAKVKSTMKEKSATFAESDFVVAALRAGSGKSAINMARLRALFTKKKLTVDQLLECATVSKKSLEQLLSGDEIDSVTDAGALPEPSLFTELKPGSKIDLDEVAMDLAARISKCAR